MTNLAHDLQGACGGQFSLGVQHEIEAVVIWVVQYVGNLAWHQNIRAPNQQLPDLNTDLNIRCGCWRFRANNSGDECPTVTVLLMATSIAPIQGFGDINQQENTTNGNYNGFQTGLRVQNKWGLSGEIDYTWSHEIDLTTYDLNRSQQPLEPEVRQGFRCAGSPSNPQRELRLQPAHLHQERRSCTRRSWVAGKSLVRSSTRPAAIPDQPGSWPLDQLRPDRSWWRLHQPSERSGRVNYPHQRKKWFDTSQFCAPIPVWVGGPNQGFGNAGKDAIVGPGRVNFTTSLYKSFAMTERVHFELRFESFNTFNPFQYNGVNTSLNNSQFGQVTSAFDPRVMELGGKITF